MTKKNELAKKADNLPAVIDFAADAGKGLDDVDRSERTLPYILILQDNSPQVKENEPEFIEGAKPGMLLHTATQELLVDPVIIPLSREKCYTERVPKGDGTDAYTNKRHEEDSAFVREVLAAGRRSEESNWLLTPDGHKICKTIYLNVLLLPEANSLDAEPATIVLRRSKLANWKDFMGPIDRFRNKYGMFAHQRVVRTHLEKFKKASAFIFDFDFLDEKPGMTPREKVEGSLVSNAELYALARESAEFLEKALASGEIRRADEVEEDAEVVISKPTGAPSVATEDTQSPF